MCVGDSLRHYTSVGAGRHWVAAETVVPAGVVGPGALAGSRGGGLDVVVPVAGQDGGVALRHYRRDPASGGWEPGPVIATGVTGPGSLARSRTGRLDVVVPVPASDGRSELRHFCLDPAGGSGWYGGDVVVTGIAGPASLAEAGSGRLHLVVPLANPSGGVDLHHFVHDAARPELGWQRGQVVATGVSGPGSLIHSRSGAGRRGRLEVVVPVRHGDADRVRHFFHDDVGWGRPWRSGGVVTDCATGWSALAEVRRGARRSLVALVEERTRSVVGYRLPGGDPSRPWLRDPPLAGEPLDFVGHDTRRICQVTGEWDRTGWPGTGRPPSALNRTESRFGVRGTDLGVSFEHRGRTVVLFGDTVRVGRPRWEARNAIAWTEARDLAGGLPLHFLAGPPVLTPRIRQGRYNVPLDGVSDGTAMYVFFSTDAHHVAGRPMMGRCVLARSADDGAHFEVLRTVSTRRFVNVSVQRGDLDGETAARLGWEPGLDVLWLWGSGRYRASDIYLAVLPFADLPARDRFDLRYFSGDRVAPHWSHREDDATPVILNGGVGELSVRWNEPLRRYLAMFASDNPRAVLLHEAPSPWGPWSPQPVGLFDATRLADPDDPCSGAGYGNFIHVSWAARRCDHVQDDVFGRRRDDEWGGEYAPYQLGHLSTPTPDGCVLYYLLSTWNPYQVMLMATPLAASRLTPAHPRPG